MSGRAGAVLIVAGGASVALGSFTEWGVCPKDPCEGFGGLFRMLPVYGVDFGPGVLTALLGVFLVVVGLDAFRRGGESPDRRAACAAATGVLMILALWLIRMYAFPLYGLYGPRGDFFFVLPGGLLAAIGSRAIRDPEALRSRAGTGSSVGTDRLPDSGRVDALRPPP